MPIEDNKLVPGDVLDDLCTKYNAALDELTGWQRAGNAGLIPQMKADETGIQWVPLPGGGVGDVTNGDNIGVGQGEVFAQKNGTILEFKRLQQSGIISIINNANEIIIDAPAAAPQIIQEGVNIGIGAEVYKGLDGNNDLEFRKIREAPGIFTTVLGDDVLVGLSGSGLVPLTPINGYANSAALGNLQYERVGKTVYIMGGVSINAFNSNVIATLPVGARPNHPHYYTVSVISLLEPEITRMSTALIDTNGDINIEYPIPTFSEIGITLATSFLTNV